MTRATLLLLALAVSACSTLQPQRRTHDFRLALSGDAGTLFQVTVQEQDGLGTTEAVVRNQTIRGELPFDSTLVYTSEAFTVGAVIMGAEGRLVMQVYRDGVLRQTSEAEGQFASVAYSDFEGAQGR